MSAFNALLHASHNFEKGLQQVSNELCSVRITNNFEDTVEKKLRDLTLLKTKLKLLRAKPLSLNPEISEWDGDKENALCSYSDAVEAKLIEEQLVKSAAQAHAVKHLLTAPASNNEPEVIERKKKLIEALSAFQTQEAMVQHLDRLLREREAQLASLRQEWDRELAMLKDMKKETAEPSVDSEDPLYRKLSTMVQKLQMMCWLAGRLGAPRSGGYDWLADPQSRLQALKLARTRYSIDSFLQDIS